MLPNLCNVPAAANIFQKNGLTGFNCIDKRVDFVYSVLIFIRILAFWSGAHGDSKYLNIFIKTMINEYNLVNLPNWLTFSLSHS